jgi:hypothetical protein
VAAGNCASRATTSGVASVRIVATVDSGTLRRQPADAQGAQRLRVGDRAGLRFQDHAVLAGLGVDGETMRWPKAS